MELPYAKYRDKYIELVKEIEDELKSATATGEASDLTLHTLQQKLDQVAAKYQDDEKIGSARYKLYELQASVHYFEHQDEKALDFINHAIELRGSTYQKAEKLKEALASKTESGGQEAVDESKMTKAEKRKRLIGLEGWLALFIVGQFIALLMTVFNFFVDGFMSSSDVDALNEYESGLGDTLYGLTVFENIAVVAYLILVVAMLTLLFRKRKLAKPVAIATLVFGAAYGAIDYAVASSIFSSSDIFQTAEMEAYMNKYAGDVGRSVIAALVWVPYFLVSKRVKATLTRG